MRQLMFDKQNLKYFAEGCMEYKPLRTLDEIRADIFALESQTEGLLHKIVGSGV